MGEVIGAICLGVISIACFVFSYLQFHEKGFLFNNAYIYASKEERETLNKKPYYQQSGVVLFLIGILFLINACEMIFQTGWLFYLVLVDALLAIVYAIGSTSAIQRRGKHEE